MSQLLPTIIVSLILAGVVALAVRLPVAVPQVGRPLQWDCRHLRRVRRTPHSLRPPRSEVKYVYKSLPRTPSVWGRLLYCRCLLKIRDDLQELSSVLLRLEAAHAAHVLELTQIPWLGSRHLPQGLVGENHKSRHAPEAGQVGALLPQPLEEGLLPLCQGAVLRPPGGRPPAAPPERPSSSAVRRCTPRPPPAPRTGGPGTGRQ